MLGADQGNDYLEALTDGTLAHRVTILRLDALLGAHPALAPGLVKLYRRMLIEAHARIEDLALHDLTSRLARYLAWLAMTDPARLAATTQRELAAQVGASREEVARSLRKLRDRGLIDFRPHRHGIVVLDPSLPPTP